MHENRPHHSTKGYPMIRNPFARTRRPRPTDPDPEYSHLDRLDGLGTRYDAQMPDVRAAEAPGGDLAAMAAPWPGMARDDLGTYAEPVKPRGRHRQTDPLDLILADLRDIEDRLS